MIEITGEMFYTSWGTMVICDSESLHNKRANIGDTIAVNGKLYKLCGVVPPFTKSREMVYSC